MSWLSYEQQSIKISAISFQNYIFQFFIYWGNANAFWSIYGFVSLSLRFLIIFPHTVTLENRRSDCPSFHVPICHLSGLSGCPPVRCDFWDTDQVLVRVLGHMGKCGQTRWRAAALLWWTESCGCQTPELWSHNTLVKKMCALLYCILHVSGNLQVLP